MLPSVTVLVEKMGNLYARLYQKAADELHGCLKAEPTGPDTVSRNDLEAQWRSRLVPQ